MPLRVRRRARPATAAGFDVVFSRFGVMFFADPVAAFGHLRALGRPDGRLGFCCWGPPAANPWMALPVMATSRCWGPRSSPRPANPDRSPSHPPELIGDVLDGAGWCDIAVDELTLDPAHPAGDAAAVADVVIEFSPTDRRGPAPRPERCRDTRSAIADALRPLERDGVVHLHASALIVTANA